MARTEAEPLPYSRYIVPVLLMIGWIAGCALMVYYVFS
ncbi:sarcoplasmic/endoplasmic reticulum calcium ATPase regulator DWORF [Erythrolamprus reginae]